MENITCPVCEDTGWIPVELKGKSIARRCECFKKRIGLSLLENSNIPKRYNICSFENFEIHNQSHRHALKISRKFAKNYPVQDIGLIFIGPCGVGKTHLAAAFLQELIKKKKITGYFCDFRELIRKIQGTYNSNSLTTEANVLEPIFQSDVLVLDELGAKRTSAWVEETVFYIINYRYNHKKLSLFTSNYLDQEDDEEDTRDSYFKKKDDSLVDRIGVRLRSRLYEMCKIVELDGDDYRKMIKQASYRS